MRSLGLVALALLSPACGGASGEEVRSLPDALLVSLDTLRADRLSCYGSTRGTTPSIDAVAASGVRFAEAHAPSSNTKPSHMSMFTGLDPLAHDVRPVRLRAKVRPALSASLPTLPELLREAGYRTASFTDRGGLPPSAGFSRGFDFEVFFHTYETHAPYLPPEPYHGRFADADYRGVFRDRYGELVGTPMAEFWREKGRFLKTWEGMDDDDVRFASDLYDEEVAWTDHWTGRLWRSFRQARGDDSVLVLLSDHGEAFYEHERLGHQRSLYAELVRVPLILVGPRLPAGRVVDEPVSLTALLPTLLEYLGLPAVETQAPSFLPLALGDAPAPAVPVYSQVGNRDDELRESVSLGGLRLLRTTIDGEERLELFDWRTDPGELVDLAAGRPDDVRRLAGLLDDRRAAAERIRAEHPPGEERPATEEEEREIEGLGYAGDDE
jgi:arylsulfatase A-like enzyme